MVTGEGEDANDVNKNAAANKEMDLPHVQTIDVFVQYNLFW